MPPPPTLGASPGKAHLAALAKPSQKKVLVLDMDETLIHTSDVCFSQTLEYITVEVDGLVGYAYKRPHVDYFLEKVVRDFDVYIFTAGSQAYAQQILDKLCPFIPESHRFYRDSCTVVSGRCFKDLRLIHNNFAEIVLVDDSADASAFYPRNTVSIPAWNGNISDSQLLTVYNILRNCLAAKDVRVPLGIVRGLSHTRTTFKPRSVRQRAILRNLK